MLVDRLVNNGMLVKMEQKKSLEAWQQDDAARLRQLFQARTETADAGKLISQMEFGAKYGIGSQGMVWQYLNARRPLNIKAAVAFAKGLRVSVADFSETLAAQIEDASQVIDEKPTVHLADINGTPTLQWVSSIEAELLNAFRACERLQQVRLLSIATGLATAATGQQPKGDGRSSGGNLG